MTDDSAMKRNVRLYPWYMTAVSAHFWLPAFFLYFNSLFSLEQVLVLEAVYYACVVFLEVPSGYLSDRIGRKPVLVISALGMILAHSIFVLTSSFLLFCVGQLGFAICMSFRSGSDVSLHHDSLSSMGREAEFDNREARVASLSFMSGAIGALLGGIVAAFDLRYAYGLSLLAGVAMLFFSLSFCEPPAREDERAEASFVKQLKRALSYLSDVNLRWLFLFMVFMIIVNHIPFEFYQPYLKLLFAEEAYADTATPISSGFHTCCAALVAAWISHRSIRMRELLGLSQSLLLAAGLQVLLICFMAMVLHPIVAVLLILRSVPRGIMTAPFNAAVSARVPRAQRATFFSLQSLCGRGAFSLTLLLLSELGGVGAPDGTSSQLQFLLWVSGVMGVFGVLVLYAWSRKTSFQEDEEDLKSR